MVFMGQEYPLCTTGVPSGADAALQNGKTYFFKSGNYWRMNDDTGAVDRSNPPFPRDAGQWWFGCPKDTFTLPFVDGTHQASVEYNMQH